MNERKKVVLIVDDEQGMRDMLSWSLDGSGFEIRAARDGREALELLEAGPVDVIVTDLTMPRQSGFELLEAVKDRMPRPATIVITGFATVEMAVHAMRRGASDVLLKPFPPAALLDRIRQVIAESAAVRPPLPEARTDR